MKKIIYFSAKWCGPCTTFKPVVEQLQASGVHVTKVDVDENTTLATQFNVSSVPTMIIVEDGIVKTRFSGVKTYQYIMQLLNG